MREMAKSWTLDDIRDLDRDVITPAQAAPVLGTDPQHIRMAARKEPGLLGFPVIVIGSRVKIPRLPFIAFITGQTVPAATEGGGGLA